MTRKQKINFLKKLVIRGSDECWGWTGWKDTKGYGMFWVGGTSQGIHRIMWDHVVSTIPTGKQIHHYCDNTVCSNPNHLWMGTQGENMDDKVAKGRQIKGKNINTAKLTEEYVRYIRLSDKSGIELADQFGVSKGLISMVRNNQIWQHVNT